MAEQDAPLDNIVRETFDTLDRALEKHRATLETREVGTVTQVGSGIARVRGFTTVNDNELIQFPDGLLGIAANLDVNEIGIIVLGPSEKLNGGDEARRTHRVVDVPVGEPLLGRVVDAMGRPLDEKGPIRSRTSLPIDRTAPPIIARAPVAQPLQTGIKAIDAAIPVGRGQRELILGDRQTGKTAIAVAAIINQRDEDVVCVYCAIGQRGSSVSKVIGDLRKHGVLENCIIVVASGDDPPGLQYVAPYAATSMAEYFMERGRDVLIVYDDLTRHARAYRELSLLLRRPPGREAYPGDIFYIHSRLLERATHLRDDKGGGSLTALPIIETQAQNISAYIPTNLISITDGQIYLSPELFQKGQFPAIDVGKSVSRVGGKAQLPAYRTVAGDLRLYYAQFEELETFARFGTRLDDETRRALNRGRRVREILNQAEQAPLAVAEQIAVLVATTHGLLDELPLDQIREAEHAICRMMREEQTDLCQQIERGESLASADVENLLAAERRILDQFSVF
jgi:F-type H+-transporting ATPase subunit alpha